MGWSEDWLEDGVEDWSALLGRRHCQRAVVRCGRTGRGKLVGGLVGGLMGGLVGGDDGGVDGGMVGVQDYRLVDGGVGKLVGCLVGGVVRGLVRGLERWEDWVEDWSALLGRRRCQRFFLFCCRQC